MAKCWAAALGNCSDRQSKEHYFTQGLFTNEVITVGGFEWLKGKERSLNLSSLTANILCVNHNTSLSPVDSEAIKFFRILEQIRVIQDQRISQSQHKSWSQFTFKINGNRLERWMMKTAIGFFCVVGKDEFWHVTKTPPIRPPLNLIEAAYGYRRLDSPMGLYAMAAVGDQTNLPEAVGLVPLHHPEGGLIGATIFIKGIKFLLWFYEEEVNTCTFDLEGRTWGQGGEEPIHHLKSIKFNVRFKPSGKLKLEWFHPS